MNTCNCWEETSKFNALCTTLLIKFQHKLRWDLLSALHRFTVEELGMLTNWVSRNQLMTDKVLELHGTFLDWPLVYKDHEYQILKCRDKVDWEMLFLRRDSRGIQAYVLCTFLLILQGIVRNRWYTSSGRISVRRVSYSTNQTVPTNLMV